MADTLYHAPRVGLAPRIYLPATEDTEYQAIREKFKQDALGQLEQATQVNMETALDGLPYPVKCRHQGALDEWQVLFKAHVRHQRIWNMWPTPRATCLDRINELCWLVDQRPHPHPLSQRSFDWPDAGFATVVRWGANSHFERKRVALIETTPALNTRLMQPDIDGSLPMHLFSPPFSGQFPHPKHAAVANFKTPEDCAARHWIDGIFCFVSKSSSSDDPDKFIRVIELVLTYVTKNEGMRATTSRTNDYAGRALDSVGQFLPGAAGPPAHTARPCANKAHQQYGERVPAPRSEESVEGGEFGICRCARTFGNCRHQRAGQGTAPLGVPE